MSSRSSTMGKLRVGFLSTANIGNKNALALQQSGVCELVAVASRDLQRARDFAAKYFSADSSAVRCYGDYESLLADENVDAVYVPIPTSMRVKWVVNAAKARKHVLCEKPCGCSAGELRTMLAACRDNGVLFMDGVMQMHHERLSLVRKYLDDASVLGEVRKVTSAFSFCGDAGFLRDNIRMSAALEPMGALGDLGWYNTRIALFAFNYEMPLSVKAEASVFPENGVPTEVNATLYFSGNRISTFESSFHMSFRQWVEIAGTKGRVTMDDFTICRSPESCSFAVVTDSGLNGNHTRVVEKREDIEVVGCCQEAEMWRTFATLIAAGDAGNTFWPEVALKTQVIVDALFESIKSGGTKVDIKADSLAY